MVRILVDIPPYILYDLLDLICPLRTHDGKEIIVDLFSYKKAKYHEYDILFQKRLRPYYHPEDYATFVAPEFKSYAKFIVVVRQVCHHLGVGIRNKESKLAVQKFYIEDIRVPAG